MGEEKQKTEDEELETENGENRASHFLEINKIWFTTIIPLLVSIAVAATGIASCWADIQQAKLTKMEIENINQEKQPFFQLNKNIIKKEINIFIRYITREERSDIVICK